MGILQTRIMEWVAMPSSRGSSQPRVQTQVSHIVGGFFTVCAIREAQKYWSGQPIPSPGELSCAGIQLGFSTLQADSLPTELPRKTTFKLNLNYISPGTSPVPTCKETYVLVGRQSILHSMPRTEVARLVFRLVDWL